MELIEKSFSKIESEFKKILIKDGVRHPQVKIEKPVDFRYGDVSTSAILKYAKIVGKDPYLLAQKISSYLSEKQLAYIQKIETVRPGYINIFFTGKFFRDIVAEILKLKDDFGRNTSLKNQEWVVEHTSPNPNKAMHLGHLRNNLVGMSLVRALSWNGASVTSDAVDNNRGIAIAKLMWGFLSHMRKKRSIPSEVDYWANHQNEWFTPEELTLLPDLFVTKCYILGESDFKKDPVAERKIRNFVLEWENNNENVWKLWAQVLKYSYEGIERTLNRIGNHWDKIWHEHEHYKEGKEFVAKGLKKGLFKKLEDGAIITDLTKYNIPDTILLKNDGTSLYITQDIALTALKKKLYNANKLIWVIGPEQALAMKQLFAVCEQLGIGKIKNFTHIPYGYVGLKDNDGSFKKMSSREGTVVLIDDVIDNAKEKILKRFLDEGKKNDNNLYTLAEKMALAAVKFSLLKSDRNQNLSFDVNQSIETIGDSGVYALYTYARIQSILRKNKNSILSKKSKERQEQEQEKELLNLMIFFTEVIKKSIEDFSAHHIAQYLIELCSAFNVWYGKEIILDGSEQQSYKVAITEATGIIIKNGLSILGIETIEQL